MVVVMTRISPSIGRLENRLWMLSWARAGVPPTSTSVPRGGCRSRSSASFLGAVLASTRPFCSTRTDGSLVPPSCAERSCHIFEGSSVPEKPDTV